MFKSSYVFATSVLVILQQVKVGKFNLTRIARKWAIVRSGVFVKDMFQIVFGHATTLEKALMSINIERAIGIKTVRTERETKRMI